MDEKLNKISAWLGSGSINIFGLPFAGKDTQGNFLVEKLGGVLISGGDVLRHAKQNKEVQRLMAAGEIIPSDLFEEIVVPFLSNPDYIGRPLILSEVGRLEGEQIVILKAAEQSSHPTKAVILLNLSDDQVFDRFEAAKKSHDRGDRDDDNISVIQTRLDNFKQKVMPVIDYYRANDLLIEVDGSKSREQVTESIIEALTDKAS